MTLPFFMPDRRFYRVLWENALHPGGFCVTLDPV